VAYSTASETTRLSEAQARALADWWGGTVERITSPDLPGETWYGVVFPKDSQAACLPREPAIFSLEEARFLENLRDVNNPNAPDWVG
jgi:hypothetical protein